MYRKQLTWQKILCFAAIAVSAIVFLYALGLMTDLYDSLYPAMMDPNNIDNTYVPGSQIYYHMQPYNKQLLSASIVMILLSCALFITNTHSRRRYYVGNILTSVAWTVAGAVISFWAHGQSELFKAEFLQVDFKSLEMFSKMMKKPYIDSTFWFDAHYAVFALVLLVGILLIVNLCWKFSLMNAEKRLIEEGKKASA
ncbi:MAG: hypothetical protein E7323_10675 [Clostridiales bacterium]|nr:hypothetical protein [Clostridiales bacterium]